MSSDLAQNLRLLCSYYRSIAEVCRRIGINRAQFNKYLSGHTQPSRYTLAKICDFFGVEPHEIVMPSEQFAQIVRVRSTSGNRQAPRSPYAADIEKLTQDSKGHADKYLGFYFEYHYSMTFQDHIIRSLLHIESDGDGYYFQRFERMRYPDRDEWYKSRYRGMLFFLSERIFLIGYEALTRNEIAQTILYPTYKSRVSYLSGLKLGVSASDRRDPVCTKVVLESLGRSISVRSALKLCGVFGPESEEINPNIRKSIRANTTDGPQSFFATPL
ncbi:helix-turn-helix transcriptional regulator [Microbulbifer thermotolerans]|uniref:Transcriptional regulator n=1 Tax=Microbulbifer thermotolerans TaxID=252514 RepID=A0A143HKI4_MICTH|nr:helix-turn-helix transcriptional regulator [Microbulbifer thermotolerans]AMX02239.1 transcriptional regulator [Microbulbifer thermotolerans]MCX2778783.1 helix-turn-helix transcriptional regulator [Microbulbifer thermotolerans]MCX2781945.1 helix-turn-helix transcriptional regulator [Microbulbifer thermotolerans]MCX2793669.1 helix-turn-helix transcriptional regulator [Microbulbifer thermotolerans]MCX2800853.1 helix-turn-helix transcriptional regulator [Microbulbifer thermotolerans]